MKYRNRKREVRRIKEVVLAIIATTTLLGSPAIDAEEIKQMHTTAYCTGEITASGKQVEEGMAATDRAHMGCIALIYKDQDGSPGEFITALACEDTGRGGDRNKNGVGDIIEGLTIDVYRNDLEGCRAWAKLTQDEVWVRYIKIKEDRTCGNR